MDIELINWLKGKLKVVNMKLNSRNSSTNVDDNFISRLGLGIDGQEDERLAYQQARDAGHLGGLNYYRD